LKGLRLFLIIGSIVLVALFSGMTLSWINDKCPNLSQGGCQLMWGTAIASMLGGALLAEILIARRKTQEKWQAQVQDMQSSKTNSSHWYVWLRPVAWVTLSGLLAGLPLIVQGAFILTLSGTITGLFLDILIRAMTNRLPTLEEGNKT
jgi:hypothetical protein